MMLMVVVVVEMNWCSSAMSLVLPPNPGGSGEREPDGALSKLPEGI